MSVGYPQFSPSARKGELGIQIVTKIVNDDFGWLFKRNHQEHDFGIDGHVELITETGSVTGQMFAVQVKFGKTFFQEKTKWGYIYRGEEKHFNYFYNYPIPIVIIICHPTNDECYWVKFSPEQTQRVDKKWKITIPFDRKFHGSKELFQSMFPSLLDGLSDLEIYWETNGILAKSDYIAYVVDRSEIESLDHKPIRSFFDRLTLTKELTHHCQGKVEIAFHGYDDDSRELYEIKEIRKYISLVEVLLPELFFFSRTEEPTFTLTLFAIALSDIHFPDGRKLNSDNKVHVEFDTKSLKGFIDRHFIGLNNLTDWLGMSTEENKKITFSVIRHIFPNIPKSVLGEI